jgi:nucleotide-binding universal stress UspA family protein
MKNSPEFKKILLPLDFSDASMIAFEHALDFAKKFNSEILLVHVLENSFYIHDIFLPQTKVISRDNLGEIAENKLSELSQRVGNEHGITVNYEVLQGKVSKEIVNAAKEKNCDLIIMGTHGASGMEEFFIGSNAERVVVNAHCPVLTIQPFRKNPGFQKILLPIDNSPSSRQKVSHAALLAKEFGSTVMVLGLLSENDEDTVKTFNMKIEQVKEHLKNSNIVHDTKIIHGYDHAEEVIKFSEYNGADLIVMMTEQEEDSGFFMGVAAQRIVNRSKIPVLSVSPEGFRVVWMKKNPV